MNINFKRLLLLLLPTFLRGKILSSFFNSCAVAFQENKDNISSFFSEMNYHVRITPQTFSLEKMLNDKCDTILRRIYIKLPPPESPFYFTTNHNPELKYFCDNEFFMHYTAYSYDFAVYIPVSLESDDMERYIRALLNKYKLLNKSPNLIFI